MKVQSDYKIFGSDIDVEVLAKAKANADRAGVEDMIDFQEQHFLDVEFRTNPPSSDTSDATSFVKEDMLWCVTNPPYGVRL